MKELSFLNLNFPTSRFFILAHLRISFFGFDPSPCVTHNPVCHVAHCHIILRYRRVRFCNKS